MVSSHGRLWRPSAAVSNNRPMPEWRLRLARDRMLSMQDKGEHAARCYSQGAGYANLEAGAVIRCRSCGTRRYKPPVRMIKLTEQREITPYRWVHPDEER